MIALPTSPLGVEYKLGASVDRTPVRTGFLAFERGPLRGSIVRSAGPISPVSQYRVRLVVY